MNRTARIGILAASGGDLLLRGDRPRSWAHAGRQAYKSLTVYGEVLQKISPTTSTSRTCA